MSRDIWGQARPYGPLYDGRFQRLQSSTDKLVYLLMVAASDRFGSCAGWLEISPNMDGIGVNYHEWRRIRRRLVNAGLITMACEILP